MKIKLFTGIIVCAILSTTSVSAQGFMNKLKNAAKTAIEKPKEIKETQPKQESSAKEEKANYPNPHKTLNTKIIDGDLYRVGKFFSDGMLPVTDRLANKLGFMDINGNITVECKYNVPFIGDPYFNSGVSTVTREINGKKTFIIVDKAGTEILMPSTVYSMSQFSDGRAIACESLKTGGVVYFVDTKGKKILTPLTRKNKYSVSEPEAPRPMKENLIGFYDYAIEKWGFADNTGKVIVPPQFKEIQDFSEGLAAVKTDRLWGFIDNTGKIVIDYQYYQPTPFSCGKSVIDTNNGYIVINKNGQKISTEEYTLMSPFTDGYAFAMKPNASKMVVIDNNLNTLNEINNKRTLPQTEGYRLAYFDNGLCTIGSGTNYKEASGQVVLNPNGNIVLGIGEHCGGFIGQFFSDRAYCYTMLPSDKFYSTGYINPSGEFIFVIVEK